MNIFDHFLLVLVSLLSCVAFLRSFQPSAKAKETLAEKRNQLGKQYAALGWAYAMVQPDSSNPLKAKKHAEQGFIIADTAADGKRDFTDKQASVYIDAEKPK